VHHVGLLCSEHARGDSLLAQVLVAWAMIKQGTDEGDILGILACPMALPELRDLLEEGRSELFQRLIQPDKCQDFGAELLSFDFLMDNFVHPSRHFADWYSPLLPKGPFGDLCHGEDPCEHLIGRRFAMCNLEAEAPHVQDRQLKFLRPHFVRVLRWRITEETQLLKNREDNVCVPIGIWKHALPQIFTNAFVAFKKPSVAVFRFGSLLRP